MTPSHSYAVEHLPGEIVAAGMLADHDGLKMAVQFRSWDGHWVKSSHVSTVHACANTNRPVLQAQTFIQTLMHHAGARELHEKCIELLNFNVQEPFDQLLSAEAEKVPAMAQGEPPGNSNVLEEWSTP